MPGPPRGKRPRRSEGAVGESGSTAAEVPASPSSAAAEASANPSPAAVNTPTGAAPSAGRGASRAARSHGPTAYPPTWFCAGWQPGSRSRQFGEATCAVAELTAEDLRRVGEGLLPAREEHLRRRTLGDLVALVDAAARLWLRPDHPQRCLAEALLPAVTGYSLPVIRWGLEALFGALRRENALRWLTEELGHPGVLDSFHARREVPGRGRALGPAITTHFLAGNIPGLGVLSLVQSLFVKSACLLKLAEGEPVLTPLFAQTLADLEPRVGQCVAAFWWPGGTPELDSRAAGLSQGLSGAQAVVTATGSDEAVEALRALTPAGTRFLAHGNKVSFGVVGREVVTRETATLAARDVALYDQQGCLSPHLFYVEEGGEYRAEQFAEWLSEALAALEPELPVGRRDLAALSSLQQQRATLELRGARLWPPPSVEGAGTEEAPAFTVAYLEEPVFELSCLGRFALVKPLGELRDLLGEGPGTPDLGRFGGKLQSVGMAVREPRRTRIAEALAELGVARICPLGRMQDPPLWWYQDGRPALLDYLRFTSLEDE